MTSLQKFCAEEVWIKWIILSGGQEAYKQLLICREVCHAWKKAVDSVFRNIHNQPIPTTREVIKATHPNFRIYQLRRCHLFHAFPDTARIDRFLEHFDNFHHLKENNPFLGKLIRFSNLSVTEDELAEHCTKTLELLSKYGLHILYCRFELLCTALDMNQLVHHFSSALKLMPNLKSLSIDIYTNTNVSESDKQPMENVLLTNPLPNLQKLKVLEVDASCLEPVFSKLLVKNTHITKLLIHQLSSETHSMLFVSPLNNLEELQILGITVEDLGKLQEAPVTWPLKKLTLLVSATSKISYLDIFHLIETKWADTLTSLELSLPRSSLQVQGITLPHLQNLVVTLRQFPSMDFILPMKNSLSSLCVRIQHAKEYDESLEEESIVKFFLYRYNLFHSNIWTHFPKLKHLRYSEENIQKLYGIRFYRRDDWQRFVTNVALSN